MTARRYDGPEHESLRAVTRCLFVNFGEAGRRRAYEFIVHALRVSDPAELSPWGANYARRHLEKQLPLRGDFAS